MVSKTVEIRTFNYGRQHNHPIELDTNEMLYQQLNYIHLNPVAAGLIEDPSAWIWISCANYESGSKGKLE